MSVMFVPADRRRRDYKNIRKLYYEAFPPEERAPFRLLELKSRRKNVDFWSILDDRRWAGFMYVVNHEDMSYIFYLATAPDVRQKGIGSAALRLAAKHYAGRRLFLAEEPVYESAENFHEREKRREFYLSNGFEDLGSTVIEGGVTFELLGIGGKVSGEEYLALFREYLGRVLFRLIDIRYGEED
ncbi:MAG: GNAT family N-acetyltransferase [Ruminococcus sp.]|nr:GNAT family N-acetyltransferase [Ruminococcus sp.]